MGKAARRTLNSSHTRASRGSCSGGRNCGRLRGRHGQTSCRPAFQACPLAGSGAASGSDAASGSGAAGSDAAAGSGAAAGSDGAMSTRLPPRCVLRRAGSYNWTLFGSCSGGLKASPAGGDGGNDGGAEGSSSFLLSPRRVADHAETARHVLAKTESKRAFPGLAVSAALAVVRRSASSTANAYNSDTCLGHIWISASSRPRLA